MKLFLAFLLCISADLASTQGSTPIICTSGGFFRHPDDCTRFYRCVDLTGLGYYQVYYFNCPAGTVFDESLSVCNYPWASAPCDAPPVGPPQPPVGPLQPPVVPPQQPDVPQQPDLPATTLSPQSGSEDTIIVDGLHFDYNCTAPGFFPHSSDCQKFWLCKGGGIENALEPELFKCPDDYLFHDAIRRCVPKDEVVCTKVPDLARIAVERKPIQLKENELSGFFARYRFF